MAGLTYGKRHTYTEVTNDAKQDYSCRFSGLLSVLLYYSTLHLKFCDLVFTSLGQSRAFKLVSLYNKTYIMAAGFRVPNDYVLGAPSKYYEYTVVRTVTKVCDSPWPSSTESDRLHLMSDNILQHDDSYTEVFGADL